MCPNIGNGVPFMTRGMSLLKKSILLITVPLAIKILFITIMFSRQAELEESQEWVSHTKDVITNSHELMTTVSRARASTQIYAITGRPEHKAETRELLEASHTRLKTLKDMVPDNPEQAQRLKDFETLLQQRAEWSTRVMAAYDERGQPAAVAELQTNHGAVLSQRMREILTGFIQNEERLDTKRSTHLREESKIQRMILYTFVVVVLILTPAIILLFYRSIGKRIGILRENTQLFMQHKQLNPPVKGDDEISDLDGAFHDLYNQMREAEAKEEMMKQELLSRAEQLAKTNAEMSITSQENEQFVYTVSHDLRSPLVNLQGFSRELTLTMKDVHDIVDDPAIPESARNRILGLLDRDVNESVTFIQNAVLRLANIIDALLRLSRAGRVEFQMAMVDINPIARRVVASLDSTLRGRGATVVLKDLPPAYTDASAVEQILGNLVGNAVNYLDPARPGKVEVGWLEDASQCVDPDSHVYYVRDNGLGIPAAHQPKVFVAFQRLHPTAAQGEGIGLALVKRTVDRLGGRIWVESTPGEGTTFYVCLPKHKK